MGYDIDDADKHLRKVVKSGVDIKGGLLALVEYCARSCPSDEWSSVLELDFEQGVVTLRQWLEGVLTAEPPGEEIVALWFGLFNPVLDGEDSCSLYISGSTWFDPEDQDWPCWRDDSYIPQGRYAHSLLLHHIYRIVQQDEGDVPWIGECILCLGYAWLAIIELCKTIPPSLWLGSRDGRVIAVGFDSGHVNLVGRINRSGFSPL
jgi:hypothetical protein